MSGYLQQGQWREGWYDTEATAGEFVRTQSVFRNWVTTDGSSLYPAESGRYQLYFSLACPWAHRTLIVRALKKLEAVIPISIVEPVMTNQGWTFSSTLPDHANGYRYLHQLYTAAHADYTGRVTVPVLWDTLTQTIVNNESADIIRMLNSAFNAFGDPTVDLYPLELREEIDRINAFVYENINNGVYRCGFASSQIVYQRAFSQLFDALDWVEAQLKEQPYLAGDTPTEADWRLFTTLIRFDAVYYGHFKCNRNRMEDFPHLSRYLKVLYQRPGIADTVNMDHIKRHYYMSHPHIIPTRIVPVGPKLDFIRGTDDFSEKISTTDLLDVPLMMPALFIGHGNPMNAIENTELSRAWVELGRSLPRPKAIVCISAHWETIGTQVTAMERPRTIHDFYGFPPALFNVEYPAPGSPVLAKQIQQFIDSTDLTLNYDWGLDHGCWSVLCRMFPAADIPVIQLSLDRKKSARSHYELGNALRVLRTQGVLIIGSGNIVHNLAEMNWGDTSLEWAITFNSHIKQFIASSDHQAIIDYGKMGTASKLAVPSAEHFLPLLYILGLQSDNESIRFFNDQVTLGAISMLSLQVGAGLPSLITVSGFL